MEWTTLSIDVNPTLPKPVAAYIEELKTALLKKCNVILLHFVGILIASMTSRIQAVIRTREDNIVYWLINFFRLLHFSASSKNHNDSVLSIFIFATFWLQWHYFKKYQVHNYADGIKLKPKLEVAWQLRLFIVLK